MKSRVFVFLLLLGCAAAQLGWEHTIQRVRVRVAFGNGMCDASARVTLMGRAGPVAERGANDQCEAVFYNVPEGTYHVKVSGDHFADADSGSIDMSSTGPAEIEIQVKEQNDLVRSYGVPGNGLVSTSGLGVPNRARKEFEKANELIARQELAQAIERLNKAIALYPAYAVAYNNLGVIYSRLGDTAREKEALQKAISVNDHFALAFVNLGRMEIASGDFPDAETALSKACAFDPTDPMTLILLSYAEFMDKHFDEAIAVSRKAHALEKPHAFVHRVAARSFEQERNGASAIAELEMYLKEEPPGPRADAAHRELDVVKAALPPSKP
jgi:TPR repeat